jgi:hypothetical protein
MLYLPYLLVFAGNGFYPPILENRRDVPAALMFVVDGFGFRFGADSGFFSSAAS